MSIVRIRGTDEQTVAGYPFDARYSQVAMKVEYSGTNHVYAAETWKKGT